MRTSTLFLGLVTAAIASPLFLSNRPGFAQDAALSRLGMAGVGNPARTGTPANRADIPAKNVGDLANVAGMPVNAAGTPASGIGAPANGVSTPANNAGTQANNAGTPANAVGTPANNAGAPAHGVDTAANAVDTTANGVAAAANPIDTTDNTSDTTTTGTDALENSNTSSGTGADTTSSGTVDTTSQTSEDINVDDIDGCLLALVASSDKNLKSLIEVVNPSNILAGKSVQNLFAFAKQLFSSAADSMEQCTPELIAKYTLHPELIGAVVTKLKNILAQQGSSP